VVELKAIKMHTYKVHERVNGPNSSNQRFHIQEGLLLQIAHQHSSGSIRISPFKDGVVWGTL